ncbi:NUDIX hydrolase domain-like protein [Podospora australis]|uniref:NUDIX hydrolase domain-like protein n=1 Tax=Podospora australis TaxID=1536484 RepID=A0AAN7AL50_9PEZI|nr:NUDIX hydrolase domain-like protein [Podospora australis]
MSDEATQEPNVAEIRSLPEGSREWLSAVDRTMIFRPASELGISCGTVTFDLEQEKVLIIWHNGLAVHQLPKGRRNIGETLWDAAIRETSEETGYAVSLPELNIATRATSAGPSRTQESGSSRITEDEWSREFIGACFYPDPQSATPAWKTVYYYAAFADSTAVADPSVQPEGETAVGKWIPLHEVEETVFFSAERMTIWKGKSDVEKSGYKFGGRVQKPVNGSMSLGQSNGTSAKKTPVNGTS